MPFATKDIVYCQTKSVLFMPYQKLCNNDSLQELWSFFCKRHLISLLLFSSSNQNESTPTECVWSPHTVRRIVWCCDTILMYQMAVSSAGISAFCNKENCAVSAFNWMDYRCINSFNSVNQVSKSINHLKPNIASASGAPLWWWKFPLLSLNEPVACCCANISAVNQDDSQSQLPCKWHCN